MVDRLERLTNLVLFLREGQARSLREIGDSVPGYPPEGEARRQAFERDKRTLRGGGVEITTVPIGGRDQVGYLIRGEDFYLPELRLDPEEQAALNLAVAGVQLGDRSGRDALWRLGLPASAGAQPVAQLPALPALPLLHNALRARATLTFTYRGTSRHVDPALLRFRGGWWYLVGFDRDRGAPRTFRVDRIEGRPDAGAPGSGRLLEGFDASVQLPEAPWQVGEAEPVAVDILVDAPLAQLVTDEAGEDTVVDRRDDGSVVLRLEVTNTAALRTWVLELGDHAQVLAPDEVRAELVGWLESMLAQPDAASRRGGSTAGTTDPATEFTTRTGTAGGTGSGGGGRPDSGADERHQGGRTEAGRRLHRLLAVLTWLARSGHAPVSELADRFGLSAEELVADLELAACCGLPPYTPDQLMEIIVDEDEVKANLGPDLARPRRLTAAEGFALAASARAILAMPGSDPAGALGQALAKLEATLGDLASLRIDLGEPRHLAAARLATLAGEQLELRYYSVSSDEESLRLVDPVQVVALDGRWYLDGYCHRAKGMRRFRVDRISALARSGRRAEEHADEPSLRSGAGAVAFVPGADATVARLAVDGEGSWLVESVPIISSARRADGRTEVTLGISSVVWFERLLLRLGTHAEVLAPRELAAVGRDAARRLLERYRGPG